jgi:hypothetical protein
LTATEESFEHGVFVGREGALRQQRREAGGHVEQEFA